MSFFDVDRFHRAARDGHLDLLQDGNRKELNTSDEDGMTPAMWAAYYGNLDALRLIVGRGGDPDKCDHYGNTPLHCASGNGHVNCVSFLVNFGVNMWALDNDFHTAKDVAVLNRRDEVLRILDQAQSKHALVNKKLVQRLKEKSVADAEKRIKTYRKLQLKAVRRAEKEEKILERQRKKFLLVTAGDCTSRESRLAAFRRDSRYLYAPKFSDIVHGVDKKVHGAVSKKVVQQRKKGVEFQIPEVIEIGPHQRHQSDSSSDISSNQDTNGDAPLPPPRHHHHQDVQTSDQDDCDDSSDVHHTADSGIGDELPNPADSTIFDRSGFGPVTFRSSTISLPTSDDILPDITETSDDVLKQTPPEEIEQGHDESKIILHCHNNSVSDSIGSASSLVRRHISWRDDYDREDDEVGDDERDDDEEDEGDPVVLFLSALGLSEYSPLFKAEKIDLESLSLLSEEDLKTLGMPLGPRRKLEKALERRRYAFEEPGTVQDSKL